MGKRKWDVSLSHHAMHPVHFYSNVRIQERSFYPFLKYIKKLPFYARCYWAFTWFLEATKGIGGNKQVNKSGP